MLLRKKKSKIGRMQTSRENIFWEECWRIRVVAHMEPEHPPSVFQKMSARRFVTWHFATATARRTTAFRTAEFVRAFGTSLCNRGESSGPAKRSGWCDGGSKLDRRPYMRLPVGSGTRGETFDMTVFQKQLGRHNEGTVKTHKHTWKHMSCAACHLAHPSVKSSQ